MHFRWYQHEFVSVESKSITSRGMTLKIEGTPPVIHCLTCRVAINNFIVIFTLDVLVIINLLAYGQMPTLSRTAYFILVIVKGRHKGVYRVCKCRRV